MTNYSELIFQTNIRIIYIFDSSKKRRSTNLDRLFYNAGRCERPYLPYIIFEKLLHTHSLLRRFPVWQLSAPDSSSQIRHSGLSPQVLFHPCHIV